jgi:DNA transformation protein and related proteins
LDPEFIRELFTPFRPVTVRRMFGGAGVFCDGLMFALVFDTRAKSPGRVGRASLAYWRLPERLYDDPDELAVWAARALAIAERKKFPPRGRAKRKR